MSDVVMPLPSFQVFASLETCEQGTQLVLGSAKLQGRIVPNGDMYLELGEVQSTLDPMAVASSFNYAIKFAIGAPYARSTIWRVWGEKQRDVYIKSRYPTASVKVSLHESGDWRVQEISNPPSGASKHNRIDGEWPRRKGRVLDQWERPDGVNGWVQGLTIHVPSDDLVPVNPLGSDWKGVRWVPAPESGRVMRVTIFVVEADQGRFPLSEDNEAVSVIDMLPLRSGGAVVVLARQETHSDEHMAWIREWRTSQYRTSVESGFNLDPKNAPRVMSISADEAGHREIWDIALTEVPE
jgi:hypothetical protein